MWIKRRIVFGARAYSAVTSILAQQCWQLSDVRCVPPRFVAGDPQQFDGFIDAVWATGSSNESGGARRRCCSLRRDQRLAFDLQVCIGSHRNLLWLVPQSIRLYHQVEWWEPHCRFLVGGKATAAALKTKPEPQGLRSFRRYI